MIVVELFGAAVATAGFYLALAPGGDPDVDGTADKSATQRSPESLAPVWNPTRRLISSVLICCGLVVLGAANSAPAAWWSESELQSSVRTSVFCLGAVLALGGSTGVVFATTRRHVLLSAAALGTGIAALSGLSGNLVAMGVALSGAAVCGWWVQTRTIDDTTQESLSLPATPEPLLVSLTVVLFCWVLSSTIHTSATSEAGPAANRRGSSRAIPRVSASVQETRSPGSESSMQASNSSKSGVNPFLLWTAVGLLVITVGMARHSSSHDRPSEQQSA